MLLLLHLLPAGGAVEHLDDETIAKFQQELGDKFFEWYNAVFEEGALTKREKALIALAVSHAVQCPYCIDAYTAESLKQGADLEEMTEAVHVANAIQPREDIDTINTELALADLESVEKALDKVARVAKSGDKDAQKQATLLDKVRAHLDRLQDLEAIRRQKAWFLEQMKAIVDMEERGWYSGSTHVHANYGGNLHNSLENLMFMSEAEDQDIVRRHALQLVDNPGYRVRLEGHTDERGSREYNIGLGERRAQAVRRILMIQGVSAGQISTVSFGEERAVSFGSSEADYAQNRGVELS